MNETVGSDGGVLVKPEDKAKQEKKAIPVGEAVEPDRTDEGRLRVFECPHCGADGYDGDPERGTRFEGSARCSHCGAAFTILGIVPKTDEGPYLAKSFDASQPRDPDGKFADKGSPGEHHAGSKREHEKPAKQLDAESSRKRVAELRQQFDAHDEAEPEDYEQAEEPEEPEAVQIPDEPDEPTPDDYEANATEPTPGNYADREEWQDVYDLWESHKEEYEDAHAEWETERAAWEKAKAKTEADHEEAKKAHHEALAAYRKDEAKAKRAHAKKVRAWQDRRDEIADELDAAEEEFKLAGGDLKEFEEPPPLHAKSATCQTAPVETNGRAVMPEIETKRAKPVRKESVEETHDGQQEERENDEESPRVGKRLRKEIEDDMTETPEDTARGANKRTKPVRKAAGDEEVVDDETSGHAGDDSEMDYPVGEGDDDAQPGEKALTMAYDRCCEAAEALDAMASRQENPEVAKLMDEVARGFEGLAKMTAEGFSDQYPHREPLDDDYAGGANGEGEESAMAEDEKAEGFSDEELGEEENDGQGFHKRKRVARKSSPAFLRLRKRVEKWRTRQDRLVKRMSKGTHRIVKDAAEFLDEHSEHDNLNRVQKSSCKYHAGMLHKAASLGERAAGDIEEDEMQKAEVGKLVKQLKETVVGLQQQQSRIAKKMQKAFRASY